MKAKQIPKSVKDIVRERSGGVCEICTEAPAAQFHHRRPRGMGGSRDNACNRASNILHLCLREHAQIESRRLNAFDNGWLVKQGGDPASVSVVIRGGRWRLADDGTVLPLAYSEWLELKGCSRKVTYPNKSDAVRWAKKNAWRGYDEQSAYECGHCGQWHLTSKSGDVR